jgi:hypothetical protein
MHHVAAALAGFRAGLPASPDRGAIAQSNVVKGQKLHPDILKGALNGTGGCRIWRPAFELEIIDSSVANRSRARELANRPA